MARKNLRFLAALVPADIRLVVGVYAAMPSQTRRLPIL